jgi:hypothetical protein
MNAETYVSQINLRVLLSYINLNWNKSKTFNNAFQFKI